MYLTYKELHELTANICACFDKTALLMDCYTVLAAKMSKYKNPINDVGVTEVYGMDRPESLNNDTVSGQGDTRPLSTDGSFAYVKEHMMTPPKYIDELSGVEKYIFGKLFAGSFLSLAERTYL